MSVNQNKKSFPDTSRIYVQEKYEVQYWSEKFRVSQQELIEAVKEVGVLVKDVEQYLKKNDAYS